MASEWVVAFGTSDLSVANHSGWDLPEPSESMEDLRHHPLLSNGIAKIQWAERHLRALNHNIDAFFADPANAAVLRADLDVESGYHVLRIKSLPDLSLIREQFAHALADVAGNMRKGLDQFAWQLACDFASGDLPAKPKDVHFPIRDAPEDFIGKEEKARRQFDPRHWRFLEQFQPYHGVAGRPDRWLGPYVHQLSMLRDLTNDDKHRATEPVLLVPAQFTLRVEPGGAPQEVEGHSVVLPDWEPFHGGDEAELGLEVMRVRLVALSEPHIDDAGQMTPEVAMAEGRTAVPTLARIGYYLHLVFAEFSRQFPA